GPRLQPWARPTAEGIADRPLERSAHRAAGVRWEQCETRRGKALHPDILSSLAQIDLLQRDHHVAVVLQPEEILVDVDIQITDLHRAGVDEQLRYNAHTFTVRAEDVPSAEIRRPLLQAEVLRLRERHHPDLSRRRSAPVV